MALTAENVEAFEKNLRTGDILFVRSKGLVAKVILAAQGSTEKDAPTHTAIVVGDHPVLVLDVISPHVTVQTLSKSLQGVESAKAFSPIGPLKDKRQQMAGHAVQADGAPYGYWSLFKFGCRLVFRKGKALPAFRIVFGILMPLLFPILAAVRLREIAGGTWFLALAEGFVFCFLGFHFIDGLHYHSAAMRVFLRYFWVGWIIYLEILAWDYADPLMIEKYAETLAEQQSTPAE